MPLGSKCPPPRALLENAGINLACLAVVRFHAIRLKESE
jgi:hypothetical protein